MVLDIGLPDSDGRDVCQALRARGIDVPVLFLTARDQLHDLLAGFAAGGDDYLAKPVHVSELVARLRALIRRNAARPARGRDRAAARPGRARPGRPGGPQSLTPTEYRLLAALMAPRAGRPAAGLVLAGWPDGALVADNTLDQYIARLRRKLAAAGDDGRRDRAPSTASATGSRDAPDRPTEPAQPTLLVGLAGRRAVGPRPRRRGNLLLASGARPGRPTACCEHGRRPPRRPSGSAAPAACTVDDARDDRALDVGTWIFGPDGRAVESPAGSSAALDRRAAALAGRGPRAVDRGDADPVRLLALPVADAGRQVATVVTSTSLAPYRQLQRLALDRRRSRAALLLLVVVHLVLRANVTRALRPVQQMSAQAGRWSADDVDRRFGAAPRPAELAELAETLDGVLDRLSAVLRHEQRLSAELSHELRTPLARLQAELDWLGATARATRASTATSYAAIDAAAGEMGEILETLMTAARAGRTPAPGRCAPAEVVGRELELRAGRRAPTSTSVMAGPKDLVVGRRRDPCSPRLLGPVLDNALRYAAQPGDRHRATPAPPRCELAVADDGPGLPPDDAARVFEPGWRGDPDGRPRRRGTGSRAGRPSGRRRRWPPGAPAAGPRRRRSRCGYRPAEPPSPDRAAGVRADLGQAGDDRDRRACPG